MRLKVLQTRNHDAANVDRHVREDCVGLHIGDVKLEAEVSRVHSERSRASREHVHKTIDV